MYNKCILIGNLVRDPELKAVGQTQLCKFTLAVNHRGKEKEEPCFIEVASWAKQAEFVVQYFKKGNPILVEGRIKQETWTQDGIARSKHVIQAEKVSFVTSSRPDDRPDQAAMINETKRIFPSDRKETEADRYTPFNGQKSLDSNNLDSEELPF